MEQAAGRVGIPLTEPNNVSSSLNIGVKRARKKRIKIITCLILVSSRLL